ncbi:MAG: flagellar assembly protein FliX [Alphaproteobacteria bacterium]
MFVKEINKSTDVATGKVKKSSGGEGFSSYLTGVEKKEGISVTAKSSGLAMNEALFATQMVGEEEEKEKKKKLIKRANTLLEKLENIRDALLDGYISRDKLVEISRFVKEQKTSTSDDRLLEIVEEIELRVEVELAKLMK